MPSEVLIQKKSQFMSEERISYYGRQISLAPEFNSGAIGIGDGEKPPGLTIYTAVDDKCTETVIGNTDMLLKTRYSMFAKAAKPGKINMEKGFLI